MLPQIPAFVSSHQNDAACTGSFDLSPVPFKDSGLHLYLIFKLGFWKLILFFFIQKEIRFGILFHLCYCFLILSLYFPFPCLAYDETLSPQTYLIGEMLKFTVSGDVVLSYRLVSLVLVFKPRVRTKTLTKAMQQLRVHDRKCKLWPPCTGSIDCYGLIPLSLDKSLN